MNRLGLTIKELDAEHRRKIEAAIENAKKKGKLPNSVSAAKILEAVNSAFAEYQIDDSNDLTITKERREKWDQIAAMCENLAKEFTGLSAVDFFPAPVIVEPVARAGVKTTERTPDSFAQELRDIAGGYQRYTQPIAEQIANRKGGADQSRENFFQNVIAIWEAAGGTRVAPAKTDTGGPMAHFFLTAVKPIFRSQAPALSSLAAIVKRRPQATPARWLREFRESMAKQKGMGDQPVASFAKIDLGTDGQ
jgi:hypothetical protein